MLVEESTLLFLPPEAGLEKVSYIEKCGLGLLSLLGPLMAVGGLDLLCVIPHDEIDSIGIPFLR